MLTKHKENGVKPEEVLAYYGSKYKFNKETGFAASTLGNWLKWGYIPEGSQHKLERVTHGLFKSDWSNEKDK